MPHLCLHHHVPTKLGSVPMMPGPVHVPPPPPTPPKPKLGGLTGIYPWTGGKPIDLTYVNTL